MGTDLMALFYKRKHLLFALTTFADGKTYYWRRQLQLLIIILGCFFMYVCTKKK